MIIVNKKGPGHLTNGLYDILHENAVLISWYTVDCCGMMGTPTTLV